MTTRQPIPLLWLLSDARNDAALAETLQAMPPGSGFVFRHYHVEPIVRRARFAFLAEIARAQAHVVVFAGSPEEALALGADGVYGPPDRIDSHGKESLLRLATAHSRAELTAAVRAGADAVFLSPVFPTASHPGARTLGARRFHALARHSPVPVIALGGMTPARAQELAWPRWGAIDGLVSPNFA